jgi:DNA repair protein RadC
MEFYQMPYLVSEIELIYKNRQDIKDRPKIEKSQDAYQVFINNWDENKIGFVEQAKVLLLNRSNRVLGIYEHSTGGVSGTVVDVKLVFAAALKANASAIILAHNHPSSNLEPSRADKAITEKFKEASKYLDVVFYDHLIIAPDAYYSFANDAEYSAKNLGFDYQF